MSPRLLMVHCTATPYGVDYTKDQILSWFKVRGWKNPGYRNVTHLNGDKSILQPFNMDSEIQNSEMTNGAFGFAEDTIHIAYVGGLMPDGSPGNSMTLPQDLSILAEIIYYCNIYPDIKVIGHNQVSDKACPSFYVPLYVSGHIRLDQISDARMPYAFSLDEGFDLELTKEEINAGR